MWERLRVFFRFFRLFIFFGIVLFKWLKERFSVWSWIKLELNRVGRFLEKLLLFRISVFSFLYGRSDKGIELLKEFFERFKVIRFFNFFNFFGINLENEFLESIKFWSFFGVKSLVGNFFWNLLFLRLMCWRDKRVFMDGWREFERFWLGRWIEIIFRFLLYVMFS